MHDSEDLAADEFSSARVILCSDHADVAVTCLNMGSLYYETHEHTQALALLERALAIDERTHG